MFKTGKQPAKVVCRLGVPVLWAAVLAACAPDWCSAQVLVPGAVVMGQPCAACQSCSGCNCTPNARCFGYFPAKWRVWPCDPPPAARSVIRAPAPAPAPAAAEPVPVPAPETHDDLPPPAEPSGEGGGPTALMPPMAPQQPAASPLPASPVESQAESQNPLRASISTEQASRASGPAPAIDAEPVGGGGDASAALFDALYADGNRPGGVEQCAVLAEGQHAAPGLGGYCPVMLVDHDRWDVGSPQWRVAFQGKTYLTSGPEAQQRFQANPNRYCPALDGADPVLVADQNRVVPGQLRFSMVYGGRLYLFADASTHDRFARQPAHYLAAVRSLSQR